MRTIGNLTISGSLNTSGSIRATTFIGVVSSSAQLSTEISGAFTSTSASLASDIQNNDTRLSTLEGKTLVSSSAQISYTGITDIPANIISSSAQLSNSTIPGNLTVGGILTAQEFHTEFVSASIIYQSGSTQFGNSLDDIHNFSGSLAVNTNNLFVSGGNVGIGTSSPAYDLSVNGVMSLDNGLNTVFILSNNGTQFAGIGTSGWAIADNQDDLALLAVNSRAIKFITNNLERMQITPTGNVGIGTTSPISSLHNVGTLVNQGNFNLYNSQGPYSTLRIEPAPTIGSSTNKITTINTTDLAFELGLSERMRITTTGNIGIGTTSPAEKLHVVGNIVATGNITGYYSSDERLKENKEVLNNPIDKINKISGYEFDWKEIPSYGVPKHDVGVIAQEIEEVLPEIVARRDDGYLAVRYEKIVPLLIEGIKELSKEVESLKDIIKNNGITK